MSAFLFLQILLSNGLFAQRNVAKLDRGLVAVETNDGIFLSWRVFGYDPTDVAFNIYRNGAKVNSSPITGASNMVDGSGNAGATYTVTAIIGGTEQAVGGTATVWDSQVKAITLSNRPSGTHRPNDISVGDLDGDGQLELVLKWYPDNAKDNSQAGNTDNTFLAAYKLDGTFMWIIDLGENIRSGAHYTQHHVGDYDLDGYAEVACKTAPGTKDGTGKYLSMGPAANDDDGQDYANRDGYVLSGPEYVTIFNGQTGAEMATENYSVPRGNVSAWGDGYGNRVDRFNSTNAYLDGVKQSMIFQRGYYTRMVIAAWDWDGTNLTNRWTFDSDDSGSGDAKGNGNHSIMAADGDNDGYDEIYTGSAAIDNDGSFMWSTRYGHGDANHIGDFDPNVSGLEIWQVSENKGSQLDHYMINAANGNVLWGNGSGNDNGRGMTGDIDSRYEGSESWSNSVSGTYAADGTRISMSKPSSANFRVYWDGDLQDELLNSNRIDKWNGGGTDRLLTLTGQSCNGTKSTPNLSADIFGDWREEVILHNNSTTLYIHTTTIQTSHKLYTLMHDPTYLNAISWQQSSYNQPPHLGFYLNAGVENAPTPNIIPIGGEDCSGVEGGSAYYDQCGTCVGGNTGIEPCIVDCNGDRDGTATIDDCGVCSDGNTGITACLGLIEGEEFCEAEGVIETDHNGYIGSGYLNFNNETGASGSWKILAQSSGTITLSVIFANGGTAARPLTVSVNGTEQATLTAAATGDWTSYETEIVTLTVNSGVNIITFSATSAEGGPNLDAMLINDEGISAIDCNVQSISLRAGWNLIGYPFEQSKNIENALSNIWTNLEMIKDMDGFYMKNQDPVLNSLNQLEWSKGYLIKVSEACELIW